MGAIDWIFVIWARFSPILVANDEIAQLSILIFCCLLGFFFLRPVVANRGRSKVEKKWSLQAPEVNDSLHELHKPQGDPTLEVLFFHGLPFGESSEPHLSTWISGDGSCIWPKSWLAEEFPDAHILAVSYRSAENFDMRIISENLISDLMQANIGQTPHCPVVLVGHSFGGLVIKELCRRADATSKPSMNAVKVEKFLDNLRGVFYYSTPHRGCADIGKARGVLSRRLFDYFTILNERTVRLNFDFQNLCTRYGKWEIGGLGEMCAVKTGIFQGITVVEEASARDGMYFNVDEDADHFSVCRPKKRTSRRFTALTTLLSSVCDNSKEERAVVERQAIRQNREFLPKHMVNMDVLVQEVKRRLQKFTTLGLVGMGGLGKTTLARAVFNELSPAYEYSCFVPDLKVEGGGIEEVKKVVWKHLHRLGRKVEDKEDWSALIEKELLLVLDNISDDLDITVLSHMVDGPSSNSRFIVTSRDRDILIRVAGIYIFKVPFLDQKNSEELFLSHAFPQPETLPANLKRDMVSIVKKCSGLPLTLEVLGNHLKFKQDSKFWQQTLQAVIKADNIRDLDKRLWAKLRVSYDGLDEVEQKMFLDATTFFQGRSWCLRDAKAAWRTAYETEYETLQWETLVDRSLVYHVEENEPIEIHDQLLSLGQKIAAELSNSGMSRVWDQKIALKLLQDNEELANQDIHALRLSNSGMSSSDASSSEEIHISSRRLHKLKKLQYLEVDGPLFIDGVEEERSFPSKLVVLKCVGRLDTFNFALQDRLVVLYLDRVGVLPRSIGKLLALRIFICKFLHSVPDEFGNLFQLEHLEFENCDLNSLPETFYKLSQLRYLKFRYCHRLRMLPEELGALFKLKDLEFEQCGGLGSLPDTFGNLSELDRLVFIGCAFLYLPNSFRTLTALTHLKISRCWDLRALPEFFGNLSALKHLEIYDCDRFQALADSFGSLSALKHLEIRRLKLQALPDSFGELSALKHLEIRECWKLRALPESFGNLFALEHLAITDCWELQALPDSFRHLSALKNLEIRGCRDLRAPDSFGNLLALEDLKLQGFHFETVVSSFGKLSSLKRLELTDCPSNILSVFPFGELTQLENLEISGNTSLIPIKKLPDSLAKLKALTRLVLSRLSIRSIPDFMKSMLSLRTLELSVLPYVKEVPTWLGDAGAAPLASSRKIFQVQDKRFSLTGEDSNIVPPQWLMTSIHKNAMEKVSEHDYEGALVDMCPANLQGVKPAFLRFCLQERGILRCKAGDRQGALEDLTAALEVIPDHADSDEYRSLYECWRYRGYVNFLLEDLGRAEDDGANALKLLCTNRGRNYFHGWLLTSAFTNETVSYMHFRLAGQREIEEEDNQVKSVLSQVIDKGTISDFRGALAIWCDFDARVLGFYNRVYFLQEAGILKRMAGDLHGALEDLTAALEMDDHNYELLKHRGYVKYLMADDNGARKDAGRCMAMDPVVDGPGCLGGLPVAFLEFKLKGRKFWLGDLFWLSHQKVMEKVKEREFLGALANWDGFDAMVCGYDDRVFFLKERGILKRMAGDLHGALKDLTTALQISGDDSEYETVDGNYQLLKHRGYVKYLMGNESGARKDAEECMAMDPVVDLPDCLGGLSVAFLEFRLKGSERFEENLWRFSHEKVMEKVKEKEFLGALAIWDDFDARVGGYHHRVFFLQERGLLKRMAGDLDGALEDLTQALEADDDNYELLKHRGYVKYLMGDDSGAQKDGDRCMAMDPVVLGWDCLGGLPVAFLKFRLKGRQHWLENLFRLSHERVMEKVREKDFLGALAIWDEFDASVCGCNDTVFFLKERGIVKRMAGDLHGSLEDLTAALEIGDDDYDLLKQRGYAKYLMGDDSGARRDAERCIAMDPVVQLPLAFLKFSLKGREHWVGERFRLSHEQVREKVKEKEFLGALAIWDDFDASVYGYNDRDFFLQVRGILQRMAGNLHGALEDLTRALEITADDYECLKHRGYVKFLLGDTDGARKDAERCSALGLKHADSRDYNYLVQFPVAFPEFQL